MAEPVEAGPAAPVAALTRRPTLPDPHGCRACAQVGELSEIFQWKGEVERGLPGLSSPRGAKPSACTRREIPSHRLIDSSTHALTRSCCLAPSLSLLPAHSLVLHPLSLSCPLTHCASTVYNCYIDCALLYLRGARVGRGEEGAPRGGDERRAVLSGRKTLVTDAITAFPRVLTAFHRLSFVCSPPFTAFPCVLTAFHRLSFVCSLPFSA